MNLRKLARDKQDLDILGPSLIRFAGGFCGGIMLLYVASRARAEPQYSPFIYLQNLSILIATISKMGVDTLVASDAEKEFRLGNKGSAMLVGALVICTACVAGFADPMTFVAALALSILTIQNALKVALATREAKYMRAALESAWVLPALLIYVLMRNGEAKTWEIALLSIFLITIRIDQRLFAFLSGKSEGGLDLKRLLHVWSFQVLNIGLFRLDQTMVATLGARGGGTSATADVLFWAKVNDLSNAVATALGGVLNREEQEGRAERVNRAARWFYPLICAGIYFAAWMALSRQMQPGFVGMGIASLGSACLALEINRCSFALLWRRDYSILTRTWGWALMLGLLIVVVGLKFDQIWLLPMAVTIQLFVAIAYIKSISKPSA